MDVNSYYIGSYLISLSDGFGCFQGLSKYPTDLSVALRVVILTNTDKVTRWLGLVRTDGVWTGRLKTMSFCSQVFITGIKREVVCVVCFGS